MKKRILHRLFSMLLAAALLISSVDYPVLAAEVSMPGAAAETTVNEETDNPQDKEEQDTDSPQDEETDSPETGAEDPESGEEEGTPEENEDQETPDEGEGQEPSEDGEEPDGSDETGEASEEVEGEESEPEDGSTKEEEERSEIGLTGSRVSAHSTNSFGRLFENAINAQAQVQTEEYTGCKILSIEMSGTQAEVSFQTVSDAALVVGVYEDDGVKLLGTGSAEVLAGETDATVSIDIDDMPSNYLLKGYLIETDSLRPLSAVYISEDYTKAMQEFLAKTTEDFPGKPIINLDESINNNFLVLADGVKVIPRSADDSVNVVTTADEETLTYVIENADEKITGLEAGDTFAYYYVDNSLLIIKIASINVENPADDTVSSGINNQTVTIQGEEIDFSEIFAYVKIGADTEPQYAKASAGTDAYGAMTYKAPSEYNNTWEPDEPLGDPDDEDGDGISYSIAPSITTELTIFYSDILFGLGSHIEQVRIELLYEAAVDYHVNTKKDKYITLVEGADLATSIPGVMIGADLKLHLAVEGEIGVKGSLKGSVGWQVLRNGTVQDISENPYLETEAYINASASIGFVIAPHIYVLHEKFLSAEISAECGVELEATYSQSVSTNDEAGKEKHECVNCIDGDVNLFLAIDVTPTILGKDYPTSVVDSDDAKVKIGDFYYSFDHNEFGWWKECPYKEYRITVTVHNQSGRPVSGARVNNEKDTDPSGQTWLWLPEGVQIVYASKENSVSGATSVSGSKRVTVDGAKGVIVKLGQYADVLPDDAIVDMEFGTRVGNNFQVPYGGILTKGGTLYMVGHNVFGTLGNGETADSDVLVIPKNLTNVKAICMEDDVSAAITKDGSLYMWGYNYYGQLGIGNTDDQYVPRKVSIPGKVKNVITYNGTTAAITEAGALYLWGRNSYGQVGNGSSGSSANQLTPVQILTDKKVRSVSLGDSHSAAITEDGELYLWGYNSYGQVGNGDNKNQSEPVQVLSDETVQSVSLGNAYSGAVTEDGNLYMWGNNFNGALGDGTTTSRNTPQKIEFSQKVKTITLSTYSSSYAVSAAIMDDGSLYTWGYNNSYGILGDGSTSSRTIPEKVAGIEHAKQFVLSADNTTPFYCAVLTEDGSLYTWGYNGHAELGQGTTESPQLKPRKVLTNVINVALTGYASNSGSMGMTYAITEDGTLWMWGRNTWSWVKDADSNNVVTPTRVNIPSVTSPAAKTASISALQAIPERMVITPQAVDEAQGTATFTDLLPNETYNFYAMKSRTGEGKLDSTNLLYITQLVSDGTGALNIEYQMVEEYENPEIFLVGETRTDLSSATVTVSKLIYNGKELYPQVNVALGGQILEEGVDYLVYGDCVVQEIGRYSLTIKGIGCYSGEKAVTFRVQDPDNPGEDVDPDDPNDPDGPGTGVLPGDIPSDGIPEGLWIAGIVEEGYPYTGQAIKPEVRVYDGEARLIAGKDYTISYKNNTKVNDTSVTNMAPTITVKGKGNYGGSETEVFKILPIDLEAESISIDDIIVASNGKVQKPIPTVTLGGKKLSNNKDYIVEYPSQGTDAYKAASEYEILVKAKAGGNFIGQKTIKLTITDKKLISKATVGKIGNQPYKKGEKIEPALTVKLSGKTLSVGTDYTVEYQNNSEVGTATAVITGINEYTGTKKATFKIVGTAAISKAKVSGIPASYTYSGTAYKPEVTLTMGEQTLIKDTDYKVSYSNNTNAGKATVTIQGIGGYTGSIKKTFKINAYNLDEDEDEKIEDKEPILTVKYVKGGCQPDVSLSFDGVKLVKGKDYTITYRNNKKLGSAVMLIKGKGNFKGTREKSFTIRKKNLNDEQYPVKMTLTDVAFVNKAGKYVSKPVLTDSDGKKLAAGTDYDKNIVYALENGTILDNKAIPNVGTVIKVTVTGKGKYEGTLTGTYKITKNSFNSAKITVKAQPYTGKPIELKEEDITVKIGSSTDFKLGKDYEIVAGSYQNNTNKGTASVTIKGIGDYGGSKTVKFKIVSKSFEWFWRLLGR